MEFLVKKTGFSSGGPRIVYMNNNDATALGVHKGNRIMLSSGNYSSAVVVDISYNNSIKRGSLSVNEEVRRALGDSRKVKAELIGKPISLYYIRQKIEGKELKENEIRKIIEDIVSHTIIDFEISFFVAAGHVHGFTDNETIALTKAMISTGEILRFGNTMIYDKHCTGGVPNNRTTMIMVPILASLGLKIPKTSSRSITSPAGTADTMEVLANVHLSAQDIKRIVDKENGCIAWGGSLNLAPADDAIINVEHPLGLDARGQLIASVLAKKASVSSKKVLIDIPIGKNTKFKTRAQGNALKKKFELVGRKIGMDITTILTDGEEPIGRGIGPALEARDVLWILENDSRAPKDLKEKSCMMAGILIEMSGKSPKGKGVVLARNIIDSGEALKKMKSIIKAQGKKIDCSKDIKLAKYSYDIRVPKKGLLKGYHTSKLAVLCHLLGAPQDSRAGAYIHISPNSMVKKGDIMITAYADSLEKMKMAKSFIDEHHNTIPEY
ncbi:MAG: thymidine phosphorylase [Candidatus Woesearchaeota archaeon]